MTTTLPPTPAGRWPRERIVGLLRRCLPALEDQRGFRIGAFFRHGRGGVVDSVRACLTAESIADGDEPKAADGRRLDLVLVAQWITELRKVGPDTVVMGNQGVRLYLDREAVELAAVALGIEMARPRHPEPAPVVDAVEVTP